MKKTTAVLMAVFLMLCSLPAGADAVLPAGPAPDEERVETPDGITFITAYSARGSRSEGRHHYLEIGGFSVPDVFSRLKYRDFSFVFVSRKYLWGDDGYVRTGNLAVPESPSAVDEKQLEKGWYEGAERLSGTPEHWIWGAWEGGSIFAAPEKLAEAVKELKLPVLPREGSPLYEALRPVQEEPDAGPSEKKTQDPVSGDEALKALEEELKEKK